MLAPYAVRTLLLSSPAIDAATGARVLFKAEVLQRTGSFKFRGAFNKMSAIPQAARGGGVVAFSSGNHAQGVAWAAQMLGVQARIVMPEGVSRRKLAGVRRLGAEAILFGETYDEAEAEARRLVRELDASWLSPYNDPDVVAGAGTVGLEILEQLPETARIVVPVGGGGLISGLGLVAKALRPAIEIVGVNALASPDLYNAFYQLALPLGHDTLADALPGAIEAGSITRDLVSRFVDRIVLVSEDDIRRAMQFMIFEQGWIVEGGGVAGLAAVQNGSIELDRPTVAVISGGNVDADVLRDVIDI